eukprot:gb/GEZN01006632.1/.p1 GENE.gb/GEZN01006632.1/~~gb/GEZN01006632.1/.p1  ORF type:complete len:245 (-),score=18.94 gb/GEZN01006632.1/:675-1409(-)
MMRELKVGDDATTAICQTLVLIDFNGTLVHRHKSNRPLTEGGSDYFRVSNGRKGDSIYYLRPGAREFVCHLLNDPRCKVAIYTSIQSHNMRPVVKAFDDYFQKLSRQNKWDPVRVGKSVISSHSSLADGSLFLYDQKFNAFDPKGTHSWDTMRDLRLIWKHHSSKGFNANNTIMIEAERRKVRNWKENSIIPPEFTEEHVLRKRQDNNVLSQLRNYLDQIVFAQAQPPTSATVPQTLKKSKPPF